MNILPHLPSLADLLETVSGAQSVQCFIHDSFQDDNDIKWRLRFANGKIYDIIGRLPDDELGIYNFTHALESEALKARAACEAVS